MNPSKKIKTSHEEEDWFIKYKVPDEVLETIISFVPSKKNCFLVSKRFHEESIKATRNKCWLNMTAENVSYLKAEKVIIPT